MEVSARAVVIQRGTRCVRAIFEHAGAQRDFPETLDFLSDVEFAIDPFTGKPFIYRKTEGGFTLYSTGIDRDDDCGVHDSRFGESGFETSKPFGGDYVFWPLPDSSQ